jgi:hypothetical protein
MVSEKISLILKLIATYYTLTSSQIRKRIFPQKLNAIGQLIDPDPTGRQTRRLLAEMLAQKLINKAHMQVTNPLHPVTASVYYPSKSGCEALAVQTGDMTWLASNWQQPIWQNLHHYLSLSELRLLIQDAIDAQDLVELPRYFNEFDVINPEAALSSPADRYHLYTVCTLPEAKKRIVCIPDAAFKLQKKGGGSRAYYVELETGSNPYKVAAEKTPGYAALAQGGLHTRHFPGVPSFVVLVIAPNPGWRDGLRKCFAKKERPELYRFIARTELTKETFLHGEIVYSAKEGPMPLVKK